MITGKSKNADPIERQEAVRRTFRRAFTYVTVFVGLGAGYFLLRGSEWLGSAHLHTVMESIATVLALLVGCMALVRYHSRTENTFLFIGTGFLGTAFLDGYHAVVTSSYFSAMLPSDLSSLIPWSWVASRQFLSIFLLLSWLAWLREQRRGEAGRISERTAYLFTAAFTLASFLFFVFVPLPRAYYPELVFHRPEEFVPALFFLLALAGYLRKGRWRDDSFEHWLVLSLIVGLVGQAVFMSYSGQLFDFEFDAAHTLKKVSYVCVLTGLMLSMYSIFRRVEENAQALQREVAERQHVENALKQAHEGLERRVEIRTTELEASNDQLLEEMNERKQAEQALRKNEARFRAVLNSVADGIMTIDEHGIVEMFNPGAERIFGYSMVEIVGHSVMQLVPEAARSELEGYLEDRVQDGRRRPTDMAREITGQRKDGTEFPMELALGLIVGEERKHVGVVRDISGRLRKQAERAELERELRQAQKMEALGTLSGGIAHEINTPVQYVGDNIGFLKDAFADLAAFLQGHKRLVEAASAAGVLGEAVAEATAAAKAADLDYLAEEIPTAIEQSIEGIERIGEIVRAIKEFSHPDAKEKSAIDVNRAIATTITVSRNQWKYVAELETDFDASLPPLLCLPGEFNQVILNLVVNAAHAIEEAGDTAKGRIVVATRRTDGWAEIRVSDSGCGIPKENHEKIFDPFFTTKEPGKGTGQGLALCHSIITKKHGGTISLDSQVGKGTTFTIRLPLAGQEQSEAA